MADFIITAISDIHGTLSPLGSIVVAEGEDQVFAIVPYAGYTVATVKIDGTNVGAVTTYTFVGVSAAHSIAVDFMAIPFSAEQFRIDFPEFTDITKYSTPMINFWSGMANSMLSVRRWGEKRAYGLALFVAHNMALASQNAAQGALGGVPGANLGVITSQSAGPISESLDVQSSIEIDGGAWNLTVYGRMYLRLARIVGIGGIQV